MEKLTPTFDQLPQAVFGLQKRVDTLTEIITEMRTSQPPQPDDQRLYGNHELAKYLKCTVQTVIRLKKLGKLPFYVKGRTFYYMRSEIDQALKGTLRTKVL